MVFGATLPHRRLVWWAVGSSAAVALLDLKVIAPMFFPSGASLSFWPQYADRMAGTKVLAALGLLLFLRWGRWLLAFVVGVSFAQLPFNGVLVSLPYENLIGALTGLVDGALLAFAFLLGQADSRDARLTGQSSGPPSAAADLRR